MINVGSPRLDACFHRSNKGDAPHHEPFSALSAPVRPSLDIMERAALDELSRIAAGAADGSRTARDAAAKAAAVSFGTFADDARPSPEQHPPSSSNSQSTSSSIETDRVVTPPLSESGNSRAHGNAQDASQESQLLRLSQAAAAQERLSDGDLMAGLAAAVSRKRMADGAVKTAPERSGASPIYVGGHSRNTSSVSIASTASSRIGEVRCHALSYVRPVD